MKGYKQDANSQRENTHANSQQLGKSSDKIITNMLKRYLVRKEHAFVKQIDSLPKIEQSVPMPQPSNPPLGYLGRKKNTTYGRVLTDYDERSERPRPRIQEI
jgi:hypothetical protein